MAGGGGHQGYAGRGAPMARAHMGAGACLGALLGVAVVVGVPSVAFGQQVPVSRAEFRREAPFEAVRWEGDRPSVLVGGAWGVLHSIDGIEAADIVRYCRERWGSNRVHKRFEEDLVEVLTGMGHPPGGTVRLAILGDDGVERLVDAAMTEANRRRLRDARAGEERAAMAPLTRSQALKLFADAAELLERVHSYSNIEPAYDKRASMAAAIALVGEANDAATIEAGLFRLVAPSGDGHARVLVAGAADPSPFLPVLPVRVGERVAGVLPDRSGLVDPAYPYVEAIEGIAVSRWLEGARELVADGSPALVAERSARELRRYGLLAARVGAPPKRSGDGVRLTLGDARGATREVTLAGLATAPVYGEWPRSASRVIERGGGRYGYLRVARMEGGSGFERDVEAELDAFAGCDGLIVDVRGNGGGRRDLIDIVGSRLLAPGAEPVVYNAARPLVLEGEDDTAVDRRMASRQLYRIDDARWSDAARRSIGVFRERFVPEAALREERFGAWYYGVIEPGEAAVARPAGPVVVLMDAGSFSATDVFLAAMRLMPRVTLIGEASSGGSGLARPHRLSAPGGWAVELVLSSMVSFMADGRLFDRRGVEPHMRIAGGPEYHVQGGADAVLEAAVAHLSGADR